MDTVEGTVMFNCGKDIYAKANEFFKTLPYEVKKSLSFSLKDGNYIDRADFWRQALESVLTEREYHIAVGKSCAGIFTVNNLKWKEHEDEKT